MMSKTDKFVEAGQRYTKEQGKFRKQLFAMLYKLARKGCGDGGWCECLLCRVMRVVETEKFRNDPKYKSSWTYSEQENSGSKNTRLVNWRGGQQEFALGSEFEDVAYAPWYAIRMFQKGSDEGWIYWIDYAGPPQIYLTKKAAMARAKQLRKQYTRSYGKIEVVEIGVIEEEGKSKKKGDFNRRRKEAKKMAKKKDKKKGDWQKCSVCKTKFNYDKEGFMCNDVYVCGEVCAKKSAESRGNAYAIHDKDDNIIDTNADGTECGHIN
jgi:hypothetical protein